MVDFIKLKIDEIVKVIGSRKLVLDVGCGYCEPTKAIASMKNIIVGLDIDVEALLKGCKSSDVQPICALAEKLPFRSNVFDVVCVIEVIEHLEEPKVFLNEARRVLKRDGILLITYPNIASLHSRFVFLFTGSFPDYSNPQHKWHFTAFTLISMLRSCRFKVIDVRSLGFAAPYRILPRGIATFFFSKLPMILERLGFGHLGAGLFVIARKESGGWKNGC